VCGGVKHVLSRQPPPQTPMSDEQLTGRTYSNDQYRKGVKSTRRKLETIYNKKKIL